MADYYTQFCTALHDMTQEEISWATDRLIKLADSDEWEDEGWYVDWDVEPETRGLIIHSIENGSVEAAASFIQEFLKKFRPEERHVLEWAAGCSKVRTGAFSGGAVGITATQMVWADPVKEVVDTLDKAERHKCRNM